jgi:hypothetical protein
MLSKDEMDRVMTLVRHGHEGSITTVEKGELRTLLARLNPQAQDLAWPDLQHAAMVFVGMYSVAEMAAAHAS